MVKLKNLGSVKYDHLFCSTNSCPDSKADRSAMNHGSRSRGSRMGLPWGRGLWGGVQERPAGKSGLCREEA